MASGSGEREEMQRSEGVEGRFVTIARDGTLSVWNNNLSLNKMIAVYMRTQCMV